MVKTKSQRRRTGDIVKIPLEDGTHTYARVLPDASLAFYDSRGTEDIEVSRIVTLPILFFAAVMYRAITRGRWPVVGHVLRDDGLRAPPKFIQDPLDARKFSIYEDGQIRPASRQECLGLECAAVWTPEQIEERLLDHYAGRTNEQLESLKIKSFRPN
jgi:Immunity protein 26